MAGRVLVIVPARDESATVGNVVREVLAAGWDVLVVDDHSEDDTARAAADAGARVLRLPFRLGAWGAMQTGIRLAAAEGFGRVLTMDADGQHPVGEARALLDLVAGCEADVAIGACTGRGSSCRRLAWRLFRSLTGISFEDLTSGFRAYNARAVALLASPRATLLDYQDIGVLLLLLQEGLVVRELPVCMLPRKSGHSRVFDTWFSVARYMFASLVLCLSRSRHHTAVKRFVSARMGM